MAQYVTLCLCLLPLLAHCSHFALWNKGADYMINKNGALMPWNEVISSWQHDREFGNFFIASLQNQTPKAYFLEMPPVSKSNLNETFRFVIVDARGAFSFMELDPHPFARQFERAEASVVAFRNLGGDAVLIAPVPSGHGDKDQYMLHLASFARHGDLQQVRRLFEELGTQLEELLHSNAGSCVFASTAGLGVGWLHLRLDRAPKYYRHGPYKAQTCVANQAWPDSAGPNQAWSDIATPHVLIFLVVIATALIVPFVFGGWLKKSGWDIEAYTHMRSWQKLSLVLLLMVIAASWLQGCGVTKCAGVASVPCHQFHPSQAASFRVSCRSDPWAEEMVGVVVWAHREGNSCTPCLEVDGNRYKSGYIIVKNINTFCNGQPSCHGKLLRDYNLQSPALLKGGFAIKKGQFHPYSGQCNGNGHDHTDSGGKDGNDLRRMSDAEENVVRKVMKFHQSSGKGGGYSKKREEL